MKRKVHIHISILIFSEEIKLIWIIFFEITNDCYYTDDYERCFITGYIICLHILFEQLFHKFENVYKLIFVFNVLIHTIYVDNEVELNKSLFHKRTTNKILKKLNHPLHQHLLSITLQVNVRFLSIIRPPS